MGRYVTNINLSITAGINLTFKDHISYSITNRNLGITAGTNLYI